MSKKKSSGKSFYIVTAVVLLAVGAITRFAVGNTLPEKSEKPNNSSSTYSQLEMPSQEPEVLEEIKEEEEIEETQENDIEENPQEEEESQETQEAAADNFISYSMPIKGTIIKPFNMEELQYSKTYGDMRIHYGIDIVAEEGTPIKCAGAGKVSEISQNALWGTVITIDHGNGFSSTYCGVEDVKVEIDDTVSEGKIIATVGTVPCECLDESHLHFEMKNKDGYISPLQAFGLAQ